MLHFHGKESLHRTIINTNKFNQLIFIFIYVSAVISEMNYVDEQTSSFCVNAVQLVEASYHDHAADWIHMAESRNYSSELFTVKSFNLFQIHLAQCLQRTMCRVSDNWVQLNVVTAFCAVLSNSLNVLSCRNYRIN
jgi:hypothetical protein